MIEKEEQIKIKRKAGIPTNLEEYKKDVNRIFKLTKKKEFKKDFLETVGIHDSNGELIFIPLFKCRKCGRIITGFQYEWAPFLCGPCDVGRTRIPNYKIETSEERWERYRKEEVGGSS